MGHKIYFLPPNERFIVLGVILLLWLIIRISQLYAARGQSRAPLGAPRSYGIGGGAICPRCRRPFAFGPLTVNFGIGTKLTRCPYCGKWSIVQHRSVDELRAAEAAELADQSTIHAKTEDEKMQDRLDNSRYTDK